MRKKKILITGAAGYLGSIIATKLVNLGHIVTAVDIIKYDKNSLSHLFYFDNFKFLKEDVTDIKVVKNIFNISYTNPFNQSIDLLFESNNNELTKIKLFNSNGAVVKELNHFSIVE